MPSIWMKRKTGRDFLHADLTLKVLEVCSKKQPEKVSKFLSVLTLTKTDHQNYFQNIEICENVVETDSMKVA